MQGCNFRQAGPSTRSLTPRRFGKNDLIQTQPFCHFVEGFSKSLAGFRWCATFECFLLDEKGFRFPIGFKIDPRNELLVKQEGQHIVAVGS